MPTPTTSLATLRPDLADSLQEFDLQANMMGFIGLKLFPVLEVAKPSGTFGRVKISALLQERETARAPGAPYSEGDPSRFEEDSYACYDHGTVEPVDDDESAIYNEFIHDPDLMAATRARHIVMSAHERRVIAKCLAVSGTDAVSGGVWTNPQNAKPIDDVRAAQLAIYDRCGQVSNTLVVPWRTFQFLRDCDQIIDRVKSSGIDVQRGSVNINMVAQALGVDELIVPGSVRNSATDPKAAVIASLWPVTTAMLCKVARTSDIREPCLGRTLHWGAGGSKIGTVIEEYRDENIRGKKIRARMHTAEKTMYQEAAQLITGIAA